MRRRLLRLLVLIPEKKSLRLAQKAMNCRNMEKIMDSFAKINLSPVTISKRQDVKFCRLDINMTVNGQRVDLEVQVCNEGGLPHKH